MTRRQLPAAVAVRVFPALLLFAAAASSAGPETSGQWSPVYSWPQVAIHMSLMPDGRVVSFADDDNPNYNASGARLAGSTKTYIVDVPTMGVPGTVTFLPNERSNMFCSGHSFIADGRLFVIGGHLGKDGWGEPRTEFLDYRDPIGWLPGPDMFLGRWYPSACVLGNGDLVALSGTHDSTIVDSSTPEVWSSVTNSWRQLTGAVRTLPYYPFAFTAPDGRVFVAGPQVDTRFLNVTGTGAWSTTARNHVLNVNRTYGSAVQWADGRILVAGGADPPTTSCEIIDLNAGSPTWLTTRPMNFARRQHTLTMLPDGTVLVTGGSNASGFNNNTGAVLTPEIWSPPPDSMWRPMANMQIPRLYHSTTVLLPDGRVLSAGSGRPKATNGGADQLNCEIFSPPYLFKGARPTISSAPSVVNHGVAFTIDTPNAASITQVTMIRLSSTTHAFNQGQRFVKMTPSIGANTVTVTPPSNTNLAPPGFYMLFILDSSGVPSIAKMIQIVAPGPVSVGDEPDEGLLDFMALRSANPMRGGTAKIAFRLSRSEVGRVEVLDVNGRRIKLVRDGFFDAGREQVVTWDGTDDHGQRVKSGLYWYRLWTPSVTRTGKLALISY